MLYVLYEFVEHVYAYLEYFIYAIFRRHVGQLRFIESHVSTQALWKTCKHGKRLFIMTK